MLQFHRHHLLAPNQPVFTFTHPSDAPAGGTDGRNARYKELVFERPAGSPPACMHGFIGYFEAALYADVLLSTRPESHTPGMFSWFPIYFPLIRPLPLARGGGRIAAWRYDHATGGGGCVAGHPISDSTLLWFNGRTITLRNPESSRRVDGQPISS